MITNRPLSFVTGILTFALAAISSTPIASAAVIAYDGFNSYSTGDLGGKNAGTGWTSAWASFTAANDVVSGGLNYNAGSLTVAGGANTMQKSSGAGAGSVDPYFNRSFTPTTANEVWFSFLFQSTNLSGSDFLEFYLSDAAGEGNSGAVLVNFGAAGGNKFGVRANPTPPTTSVSSYGGGTPSAGVTYLAVARISGDGAASTTNYDRVELWINPSSTTLGTATASADLDLEISTLSYFGVRTSGLASTDVFQVDELRIGTTAVDVVPEPNSVLLVGIGIAGLLVLGKQRGSKRSAYLCERTLA